MIHLGEVDEIILLDVYTYVYYVLVGWVSESPWTQEASLRWLVGEQMMKLPMNLEPVDV